MSTRVKLVHDEHRKKSPSFLIYVPHYRTLSPLTKSERRSEIQGFIYAPFRTEDLFGAIFAEERILVDFQILHVREGKETIAYNFQEISPVAKKPILATKPLSIFGESFKINISSLESFHHRGYRYGTIFVVISGILATLFLSFIVYLNHQRAFEKTEEADALRLKEEDLKKALNSRDQFLSIAAHELKTPLTSLQLQVQFAESSSAKFGLPTLEKYKRFLGLCEDSVLRLILLVNDLLDISRIDSGRLQFNFSPVKLSFILNKILTLLEDPLRNSGCQISTKIQSDLMVMGDAYKLEQVFSNLLMNTVKYAPGSPISIELIKRKGMARIIYTDNGPGISSDLREKVFERYERGDQSDAIQGLGLGLYISREIIRAHSGSIFLSEPEERGVRFIIDLPLAGEIEESEV